MNQIPDVENEVFTGCEAAVLAVCPEAMCKGAEEARPARLPFVSIVETSNTGYDQTADSGSNENHAMLMYTVDVFASGEGKKAVCKKIIAAVSAYLGGGDGLGFQRTFCQPVPNVPDPSIYRMTARYEAILSKSKKLYRR